MRTQTTLASSPRLLPWLVPLVCLALFTRLEAAPAFRKTLTVNGGQVSGGPLADFPFLFSTTDPDLRTTANGGRVTNANGWDIIFATSLTCADSTSCGGNKLDHEIETYNPAIGQLIAWVRVPSLDNGTTLHVHYGDGAVVATTENRPGVWNAGYKGVWHLKETPAGVAGEMKDSTSNANNGTGDLAPNLPTQSAGQVDGSLAFDGALDRNVLVPDAASLQLPTDMTVSGWARTASFDDQSRLIVARWKGVGSNNYWLGKLNTGPGLNSLNFGVDGGPTVAAALGLVNDGLWHHVVGVNDTSANLLRIYVDGIERATNAYTGPSQTGTSELRIGRSPDIGLQDWDGGIDEVRVSNVTRSPGWIQTEFRNQSSPSTFYSLCECAPTLAVTPAGSTISVTAAGAFKLVFDEAAGGHPTQFYDLTESPIEDAVHDLAGGITTQDGLFLDELMLLSDGLNYRSDKSGADAGVLEATATRALIRSQSYFGRPGSANRMAGIRALGDWSIYGSGRMALHWERRTTSAVDTTFQQLHLNLHQQGVAPLNGWAGFTQGGPICLTGCSGPAATDFVLLQNEQVGARTDFLKILYQDWPAASESWGSGNVAQEWIEASWNRNAADTIPANTTEAWNFLTYFKPTTFTSGADLAVTTRSADYRGPDDLATPVPPVAGAGWFDADESTASPSDFFNEKEAAYTLDLDPATGLDFDIDGAANPRYHPFFKIRQYRSYIAPNTITLGGATLTRNVHFRADVMPISRSSMHRNLLWRSSLQSLAAITGPDVGSAGSVTGAIFYGTARFGNGARLSASGDSIRVPTTGNFDAAQGVLGFWYRPNYDSTDGILHDICGFFVDASNYWFFEKRGAADSNELWFRINSGGALSNYRITAANYAWRANEWVHLTLDWDDGAALGGQQHVEINDVEPSHIDSGVDYDSAALTVAAQFRFGNADGDASFAPGDYDEIEIVRAHPLLAAGGQVGNSAEFLADPAPAQNFILNFQPVDATTRRGRYLHFGATSKFRGLNVALATAGVGVPAGALEWEYWDGAEWASLESVAGFTDTTNSFTRSGNVYWTADPPGWSRFSVFGGVDIFRIRVHLAAGTPYSSFPTEGIIKTDVLLLQYCGNITLDSQTFAMAPPIPTEVKLQSFSALPGDRSVLLEWRTGSELDNLGFHVYRSQSESGPWTRLTASLIPGLGSSAVGQAYSFRDVGLSNGTRYFYRLDDVDAASKTTSHGPVAAVPSAGASAGDGTSGGNGGGGGKKGVSSSSCPDWVLAAYGSAAGSDTAAASLRCTRHGDPEAVSFSVVSRDSRSATLELRTGGFYALHEPSGTVRVFVPGFDFPQDEKAAALPIRRALAEAVVGRRVQLGGVRALDLVSFKGLVPSALGKAEMQVGRDGTVRAARRSSRASAKHFPKSGLVTLLPSLFQGETKSAVVEIAPLHFDSQRQQLVLAKRLRVRLLFTGREAGESGRGSLGRAPGSRKTVVSGETLARLYTTSRGLHAVAFEQLFPGQRRGVTASQLRLERQGEPVAFHLEPASSAFGPGGRLFFYADKTATSTDFSAEVAYELVRATDGVAMPLQSAAPGSNTLGSASVVSRSFETDRFYQPGLLDAPDPWLWEALSSGATRVKSFSLSAVSGSGTAELDVSLQGASESGQPIDHHLSVSLNGTPVGEAQFAGKTPYRMSLSLHASLLREGPNDLSLTNVADTGVSSLVFLDRVSLAHPQTSALVNGLFEGTWTEESGAVTVSGALGGVALVDVTDGARWLSGFEASGGSLRFHAEAGRRYVVVGEAGLLTPRVVSPDPSTLRASANQADYLLIAPKAFLPAAESLLQLRLDQGLQARAVSFEEIASEFGHGQASAEAIKSFLTFAFHSWARPSPRYVLLLGDSSYDPRNFIGTSQSSPLPALWSKTSYLWTVSDPELAAVNGEDELPDLAIGRLPATSAEQAQMLVDKLIAWENSGQALAGSAVLVADNPDLAGDFEANAQDIAQNFLAGRSELLQLRELGAETRPRIQAALDSGLSYLSYVGHGGAAVWASENVWNSWDAASLQAQSRQPLLITMNCLNGYFVAPAFESLSESLLKAEGRGAIAAFSPSGLSLDGPAHQYHRVLMAELTSGRHERLGDALAAAQKAYAQSGLMPELLSIYHLLGDPAMRIQ